MRYQKEDTSVRETAAKPSCNSNFLEILARLIPFPFETIKYPEIVMKITFPIFPIGAKVERSRSFL